LAILDTTAVVHLGHGKEAIASIIKGLRESGERLFVSSISFFELSAGSPAGLDDKRRRLLNAFESISFSPSHAERAGLVQRALIQKGEEIGALDCLIAGTALHENEPVITSNVKHFSRVEGLKVIGYRI